MGKTYQTKQMVEFQSRVVVFDSVRSFDLPDYKVVESVEELEKIMQQDTFRVRVWDEYNEEAGDFFDRVCELIYDHEDLIFIVDEVDNYCGSSYCNQGFRKIINYGRHKNIEVIVTARRAADIPKLVIGEATEFFFFQMIEPNQLKYLSGIYDGDVEKIKELPKHEHIHFKT
jgi:hypothetical protein